MISGMWKNVICVGTGNEGNTGGHISGKLGQQEERILEFGISQQEPVMNIQLWKAYFDQFQIILIHPDGESFGPLQERLGVQRILAGNTEILIYYGEPKPYTTAQEIYFDFIPVGTYLNSGIWKIHLHGKRIREGNYNLWLPGGNVLNPVTGFYRPVASETLTIPSTAAKVITVGAYDPVYDTYADFSGRGYADSTRTIGVTAAGLTKPDLVAPGVNIQAPDVYGCFLPVTGTSFATPIVSGAAALLMEWGIVQGNDPFLYGEKIKAYLRKGARPLRGEREYPNDRVGYGRLCVADSLPQTGTTE